MFPKRHTAGKPQLAKILIVNSVCLAAFFAYQHLSRFLALIKFNWHIFYAVKTSGRRREIGHYGLFYYIHGLSECIVFMSAKKLWNHFYEI